MLFGAGEVLEEGYGDGVHENKLHVIAGGENTPDSDALDSLNRQEDGFMDFNYPIICNGIIDDSVIPQPCPHLGGLPVLPHARDCGHCRCQSRNLASGYVVLRVVVRVGITIRIPVEGRQGEFVLLDRSRKL